MSILKLGSKGSVVIELQKLLTKHGITGRNKNQSVLMVTLVKIPNMPSFNFRN